MRSRTLFAACLVVPLLISCEGRAPVSPTDDPPSLAPAGTGNKEVVRVDESFTVTCPGGATLSGHLGGWFQLMGGRGGNLELNVFHLAFTFTNAAGERFVFHDVGPDRVYVKDGKLFLAITGRASATGVIGHVVIDLATGEAVLVAGKPFAPVEQQACEALT